MDEIESTGLALWSPRGKMSRTSPTWTSSAHLTKRATWCTRKATETHNSATCCTQTAAEPQKSATCCTQTAARAASSATCCILRRPALPRNGPEAPHTRSNHQGAPQQWSRPRSNVFQTIGHVPTLVVPRREHGPTMDRVRTIPRRAYKRTDAAPCKSLLCCNSDKAVDIKV